MSLRNLAIDASRMVQAARTGTENYSVEIIRALSKLDGTPEITLYARRTHPIERVDGVTVKRTGPSRFWTHAGLSRSMLRDRPDALFVPSHVIPAIHPKATVVTVHDLGYLHEPEAHPASQRRMLDLTTRWNVRRAARIIAISGQTRDDLVQRYGVRPDRITVVHHGVNHDVFFPRSKQEISEVIARHTVSSPYILFVSTVQPRKNVERIVEAFEMLDKSDLTLVIAGKSGWLSDPIENRIRKSSKADQIRRLGRVSDADLPALYSGARAFVLPSLFEGFGMGVIEAMACGTPVVTSNNGALAEVAGDAAVLVDPRSSDDIARGVQRALGPEEAESLTSKGHDRAASFTWESAATQTLQVIRDAYDAV